MKTPRHPVRPAFDKAVDATEAWRQQQIAALNDVQRRLYDDARHKAEEKEKARAKELEERKQADIREKMRKKILEHPRLELILGDGRRKISEVLARRLTEEYFQPGQTPDLTQFENLVKEAAQAAIREVEQEHARERQTVHLREREKTDALLRSFEQARKTQPENRAEFSRATAAGKAKTDFQRPAKGDGMPVKAMKSDALARAIEKAKKSDEQQRSRTRQNEGRGRSLTDTFNKTR